MNKHILTASERGFSLIELAIALTVLTGLGTALFTVTTGHYAQVQQLKDANALAVADRQLLHYAAIHGRLPCPDTTSDGLEDCGGAAKGALPYKTIGLIVTAYTPGEVPLRYGVYRKADSSVTSQDAAVSKDADLATPGNTNRFEPTSSDHCSYDTDTTNIIVTDSGAPVCPGKKLNNFTDAGFTRDGTLDLCVALANSSADTLYTFTRSPANVDNPVAYALAAAGSVDGDGSNGLFDGLNGSDPAGFNSPATPATTTYDDQTLARSFAEVSQHLRCDVVMRSLHELSETVAVDDEVAAQQQSMKDQAAQAVQDSIMGAISAGISMALAIASVSDASEVLAAAAAMLATHTALCAASLGLDVFDCAAIALAASAVGSASTASGLAYASVALNAAAMAAQIAAAIMFDQVAQKAGAATGAAPTTAVLNSQKQQLADAVVNRDNSYASYVSENAAATTARAAATTLSTQAATAYTASITTIDPSLIPPAKPTVTPGLTAITALDTAITAMASYETAYANWNSLQTTADAKNATCISDPACATIASTSPYATTYPDHSNANWIAWNTAQGLADGALTTLNTAKTTVINQWDLAVQAGRAWDIDAAGGNHLACSAPTVSNTPVPNPLPLEWWPTYTIGGTCALAGQFQTALGFKQQFLAKDKEASRLEASVIQKYSGWKSAVATAEQTVCAQQKSNYAAGAGLPSDLRAAVVPVYPVVGTLTTITEVSVPLTSPLTGTQLQATVDGSGIPIFSTGAGTAYAWWGSCSAIATGTGTPISITSGSRTILNQADKLGVTQ